MEDNYGCVIIVLVCAALLAATTYISGFGSGKCAQACWAMGEEANANDGCWCSESGKIELATKP